MHARSASAGGHSFWLAGLVILGGLLIGTGLSIFVAVRTASRMTRNESAKAGPLPAVADAEDED